MPAMLSFPCQPLNTMIRKSFRQYQDALDYARTLASEIEREVGLLKTQEFNRTVFSVFLLPKKENRQGHELQCEVVIP